jgi:hypothetical protein
MDDRRRHRLSLLIAMLGVFLMLVTALQMAALPLFDDSLPIFKRSRPPMTESPARPSGELA